VLNHYLPAHPAVGCLAINLSGVIFAGVGSDG